MLMKLLYKLVDQLATYAMVIRTLEVQTVLFQQNKVDYIIQTHLGQHKRCYYLIRIYYITMNEMHHRIEHNGLLPLKSTTINISGKVITYLKDFSC